MCDQLDPGFVQELQSTLRELADRFDNPPSGGEGCLAIRDLTRRAKFLLDVLSHHTEPNREAQVRQTAHEARIRRAIVEQHEQQKKKRRGPGGAGKRAITPHPRGPRPLQVALALPC
jgi:hypothetical protein